MMSGGEIGDFVVIDLRSRGQSKYLNDDRGSFRDQKVSETLLS